ncbi:MAG TPA: phasin family protein [Noviherbaspirillum sp.]
MTPLVTMYQTQLEASRRVADAVFSGTEKIDRVMIDATHRVVTEQLNLAEAMAAARDPRVAGSTLQASFFSGNRNNAVDYQKEIMRIFAEMQNEISRSWQDYVQQLRTQAANNATRPLETAQSRANDTVFDPMTSMFSVWESAFKEVADLARRNMSAARATATDAAGRAAQGTASFADAAASAAQETMRTAADVTANATAQAARSMETEAPADDKKGPSSSGASGTSGGRKK